MIKKKPLFILQRGQDNDYTFDLLKLPQTFSASMEVGKGSSMTLIASPSASLFHRHSWIGRVGRLSKYLILLHLLLVMINKNCTLRYRETPDVLCVNGCWKGIITDISVNSLYLEFYDPKSRTNVSIEGRAKETRSHRHFCKLC